MTGRWPAPDERGIHLSASDPRPVSPPSSLHHSRGSAAPAPTRLSASRLSTHRARPAEALSAHQCPLHGEVDAYLTVRRHRSQSFYETLLIQKTSVLRLRRSIIRRQPIIRPTCPAGSVWPIHCRRGFSGRTDWLGNSSLSSRSDWLGSSSLSSRSDWLGSSSLSSRSDCGRWSSRRSL